MSANTYFVYSVAGPILGLALGYGSVWAFGENDGPMIALGLVIALSTFGQLFGFFKLVDLSKMPLNRLKTRPNLAAWTPFGFAWILLVLGIIAGSAIGQG